MLISSIELGLPKKLHQLFLHLIFLYLSLFLPCTISVDRCYYESSFMTITRECPLFRQASKYENTNLACEQALLFGRVRGVSRERASERRSREGQGKGELAAISHKISFVLRPDEGKYHWLKNDVPEIKVD